MLKVNLLLIRQFAILISFPFLVIICYIFTQTKNEILYIYEGALNPTEK